MSLRVIREQAGLSREKAARALEASPTMLWRWEAGVTMPTLPYVVKMSELYAVDMETITRALLK